jgi:hypothetical protein
LANFEYGQESYAEVSSGEERGSGWWGDEGNFYWYDTPLPWFASSNYYNTSSLNLVNILAEGVDLTATYLVPEPTTILLLGFGLIGLAGYGRKKFFKK